jgi:hypothetical protein
MVYSDCDVMVRCVSPFLYMRTEGEAESETVFALGYGTTDKV